jgi:hypothetical protein
MASSEPVPGTYQSYKGDFHEVLGVAAEPASGARFVVYRSLGITENLSEDEEEPKLGHRVVRNGSGGALAVCSLERFQEMVPDPSGKKGSKKVPRFRLVCALGLP